VLLAATAEVAVRTVTLLNLLVFSRDERTLVFQIQSGISFQNPYPNQKTDRFKIRIRFKSEILSLLY